ncbi:unnamed protein product, partial [Ilex paraguariensis]
MGADPGGVAGWLEDAYGGMGILDNASEHAGTHSDKDMMKVATQGSQRSRGIAA